MNDTSWHLVFVCQGLGRDLLVILDSIGYPCWDTARLLAGCFPSCIKMTLVECCRRLIKSAEYTTPQKILARIGLDAIRLPGDISQEATPVSSNRPSNSAKKKAIKRDPLMVTAVGYQA